MTRRSPPVPPHPSLERRPAGPFGWLEAELLHDGWLAEAGPEATAVLLLLALAADRRGASFFGRDRMATALGMTRHDVDRALRNLLDAELVAFRPWQPGADNGVWQLLRPRRTQVERASRTLSIRELLTNLGFAPPPPSTR